MKMDVSAGFTPVPADSNGKSTPPKAAHARFAGAFGLVSHELPFPASRFNIDLVRARSSLKDRALDWLTEEIQVVLIG